MPRLHQVFRQYKPLLSENFILKLELGSELQKKDIEDRAFVKMDAFLKDYLKNYEIKIIMSIVAAQKKLNVVYTATDKFKYLAEMNENLNKLKHNFSLDFE